MLENTNKAIVYVILNSFKEKHLFVSLNEKRMKNSCTSYFASLRNFMTASLLFNYTDYNKYYIFLYLIFYLMF